MLDGHLLKISTEANKNTAAGVMKSSEGNTLQWDTL